MRFQGHVGPGDFLGEVGDAVAHRVLSRYTQLNTAHSTPPDTMIEVSIVPTTKRAICQSTGPVIAFPARP